MPQSQGDDAMTYIHNLAGAVFMATLGLSLTTSAIAQLGTSAPLGPIEKLKTAYLQYERAAVSGRLATDEIMLCSVIYEDLKKRAFGGDFSRLKVWADEYLRLPEAELTRSR